MEQAAAKTKAGQASPAGTFSMKLGKTTYVVGVHFSQTAKDTLEDKMKRLIGCEADGELVGVIIAGRPVSRYLDDGFTLEVTRLCTNGAKNACSFLYGAAARAAAAMGYKRIITYTLESENGASLRASGWICQGKAGGLRWTGKRQPKEDQYPAQMKLRYEKQLRKEETVNGICSGPEGS